MAKTRVCYACKHNKIREVFDGSTRENNVIYELKCTNANSDYFGVRVNCGLACELYEERMPDKEQKKNVRYV